jgi:hypothetical protein
LQFLGEEESQDARKQYVRNILQTLMKGIMA